MLLVPIKGSLKDKFKRFTQHDGAFDYFGMERGGHNGFIEWLLRRNSGRVAHINRAHNKRPGLDMHHPSGWFSSAWEDPTLVALSYGPDADFTTYMSRLDKPKVVVLVRDIRNMVASRIKGTEVEITNFAMDSGVVEKWKRYAKQVLGDEDWCSGRCVGVVFDKWAMDPGYRLDLLAKLNEKWDWELSGEDEARDKDRVSPKGGGSSWDRMEQQHHASQMKVTERWQEYKDHPLMRIIDQEALDLNARLVE